ncbi:MAG: 50S ribosomal protein L18 [Minisyncoccia bacterium]
MKRKISKKDKRIRRHKKIRAKIFGVANKPRVSVFISNKHLYAQVIDDNKGKTLISVSDFELKTDKKETKMTIAKKIGLLLAEKLKKLKIYKIVFDRGGFKYHGRVKNIAEGLREGGIKF